MVHFYSFVFVGWKQNLTWIRIQNLDPELITDLDPKLQIFWILLGPDPKP
jgi:hypothetical protein